MYPDQNQNQPGQPQNPPQYPVDYLNQIAPQQKKKGLSNRLFLFIAGGGLLLAIIVGIFALTSSNTGPTQKMQTLAARLTTLHDISDKAQKSIKSSDLRSINSSLTIILTNANRDIAAPLSKVGVDVTKLDSKVKSAEDGATLSQTLENARLNAVYDRTYAREMAYQLETVVALMQEIYSSTNSKSLKEFLESTNTNLDPLKTQFNSFNASTS